MNLNSKSIFHQLYNQSYKKNPGKIFDYAKDNLSFVQRLGLIETLPLHQGCVNTLCWNESGSLLLSGSDDQHLIVTNGHTYKVCHNYRTSHRANIFSAKFMPVSGDHHIVSCSGDGIVLYTDLERPSETYYNQFNCHSGTSYEVITIPNDPNTFFSCGEDGTVRWFDLRIKSRCKKARCKDDILILHHRAVTALSINPLMPHELAIGSSDSTVRTFDRRMLGTVSTGYMKEPVHEPLCSFSVPELEERTYRITSLSYSPDGQEMLVSYSSDHLYLFAVRDQANREVIVSKSSAKSNWTKLKSATKRVRRSPPPVRRLRLRGDWSDTGPDARPERDATSTVNVGTVAERVRAPHVISKFMGANANSGSNTNSQSESPTGIGQARPQLQATLMERMTNVLFRMLNDPLTRAALSAGGEDSLETNSSSTHSQDNVLPHSDEHAEQNDGLLNEERSDNMNEESIEIDHEGQENISVTQQSTSSDLSHSSPIQGTSQQSQSQQQLDFTQKPSCSTTKAPSEQTELNNLQDKLSSLRHGFIEKHGSEPSVSLRYSDQSSSSSTIRLGVGDELNRSNYNSVSQASSSTTNSLNTNNSEAEKSSLNPASATETEIDVHSSSSSYSNSQQNCNQIEQEMDFSSNDEMMAEVVNRENLDRSSDIELDYSDSDDDDDRKMMKNHQQYDDEVVSGHKSIFMPHVKQKYVGHRNARTMIKEATFWGNDFVMSGSDCGHVFIWDRTTAKLVMLLQADHHVVNCLQPHPTLPLLATSGIDHDVKLWSPVLEEPNFDSKMADDLMKRNEVMLEETRDTITVPAAFMIRMLACLNQIRRTGSLSRNRRREDLVDPDL